MTDVSLVQTNVPRLNRPSRLIALMVAAIGIDLGFQQLTHDVAPGLFLPPAVILAGAVGGTAAGCFAAAASVAFAAIDLSEAGPLWHSPTIAPPGWPCCA